MIRRFLALAGAYRPAMLRAIIFKVLDNAFYAMSLGIAYLAAAAALGDQNAASLLPLPVNTSAGIAVVALMLLTSYVLQWLFFLLSSNDGFGAGYRITGRLRIELADHLRKLPMPYFHKTDPGKLAHVVMQDVLAIEQIPGLILPRLVSALALGATAFAVSFALDWRMGLAMSAGLPLAIPTLILGHRALGRVAHEHGEAQARMNSRLIEYVQGIGVIKAYGLAGDRSGLCRRAVDEFRDASKSVTWAYVWPTIVYPAFLFIGGSTVLMGGAHFLLGGTLAPAAWLLFVLVSLRLFAALGELMDFSALTQQMNSAMTRISDIVQTPGDGEVEAPGTLQGYDVEFAGVGFAYGQDDGGAESSVAALRDVSFRIPENTITALVGETGAGKTTLIRLLLRQYLPSEGRLTIGGVSTANLSPAQINRLISVVSQNVFLFTESVADNIRLGRDDASQDDVIAAAKAARAHDFIMALPDGYETILTGSGAQLSGGERQRIALARAFLQDSRIIVLDEVTSALDVENERLVQEALSALVRNRTVVVIAHRLWTVRDADQILVLDGGRIIERGRHAELMAKEARYRAMWLQLQNAPGWRHSSK